MTDVLPLDPIDGRHRRRTRTRAAIVAACQELMLAGEFRPTTDAIARRVPCSVRTIWLHFRDIEALHLEAAADPITRDAILTRATSGFGSGAVPAGSARLLVRAIVLGRAV